MKALNLIASKDSLRPQLNYIQLKDEFFNVTDCNVLLKIPHLEIMNSEILEELPKEAYFLANDWKNSKIEKALYFKLNGNLIECKDKKFNTIGFLPFLDGNEFHTKVGNFPDFNNVIPKDEYKEELGTLSINPELLYNLYCANAKDILQFSFFGKNKAIKIKFKESEAIGLIMPIMFEN